MTAANAVSRLRRCSVVLVWLWMWMTPLKGWAQESGLAIVEMVTELDETGRYREIDVSTRATLSRGGETVPILSLIHI